MFKFVVIVALFGLAYAANEAAETKLYENSISPLGDSFHYAYQLSNGVGVLSDGNANDITGSYTYTSPEGQVVKVDYKADLDGYKPSGPLIPTPPPIPEAIIRAIQWNAAHPQKEELSRKP